MRQCRGGRPVHAHTEAILLHINAQGGETNDTNVAICSALGLTYRQFEQARLHSRKCRLLRTTIAYRSTLRRGISTLAVIDWDASYTLASLADRGTAILQGQNTRIVQHETEVEVLVRQWDLLADESRRRGEHAIGRACDHASADMAARGSLSAKTVTELARAGITA
jgi:hypothetical protein